MEDMYYPSNRQTLSPTTTSFSMGGNDFGLDNSMDFYDSFGDDNSGFFNYGAKDYGDVWGDSFLPEEEKASSSFQQMLDRMPVGQLILFTFCLAVISFAIMIAVDVFIMNPLRMGGARFFLCNLEKPADVKEMCFGFDRNYKNVVSILFLRDLYLILWSLLFIIPGIVKAYEYRMIPFLLAEHPDMTKEQAFATSRQMMMGEKWHAFCLDLSFIGWYFLSLLTFGVLQIFYVGPYKSSTDAALYENLKFSKGTSTTSFYRSVPPVTPIPGFEQPEKPSTPSFTTNEPSVEPEVVEEPTTSDKVTEDNAHMFEED